ncbi:tetratricopeptide repeat protein [Archangium sp.]|jgi:tetratricopeptide (TPR) repeat protein|uniref:tetratricopeptide repeat protein n=1 Tax=Archangium sp. TaxID=1872627 RepID=UPI002EDB9A27
MSRSSLLRILSLLMCLTLWTPLQWAHAQPKASKQQKQNPTPSKGYVNPQDLDPEEMATPEELDADDSEEQVEEEAAPRGRGKKGKGASRDEEAEAEPSAGVEETPVPTPAAAAQPPAPAPVVRPPPPTILTPRVTDADLQQAWDKWQKAVAALDMETARKAQQELVDLKDDVGALDMEALSIAFIRAAEGRRKANDSAGALLLVEQAVTLSPNLPYARLALAEAYMRRSAGDVGPYFREVKAALSVMVKDPRYRRPVMADLGAVFLVAVLATAAVVVGVLFARRVRFFLHDFHHLFPKAAARWQTAALAVLLLIGTPISLRLGLVPVLLLLLVSVAFYLSVSERAVAAVLLVLAALVPFAAGKMALSASFAGTVAEDVYVLERGGLAVEQVADRVRARHEKKQAGFAELFALGRFEARRGQMQEAIAHYKAAAALRPGHAGLMTNLGNAMLATGDQDGAARIYAEASGADPGLAAPAFNLAEVYRRRAAVAPDDLIGVENQRARDALGAAQRLDGSLLMWKRPLDERLLMNRLLISPTITEVDMPDTEDPVAAQRVEAQLSRRLLGKGSAGTAWMLPVLGALFAFGWGFAGQKVRASRECEKCGRPVCGRCDKELGVAAKTCAQCVNVFSRNKGAVEARVRARKQIEIERHRRLESGVSYAFGALVSGAGHLFHGLPVRGALYAFFFLLAVSGVLLRSGVLRAPYGEMPLYLKLAPLLLILIPLHLLTLRGLYRRQNE